MRKLDFNAQHQLTCSLSFLSKQYNETTHHIIIETHPKFNWDVYYSSKGMLTLWYSSWMLQIDQGTAKR